MRYLIPTHYFIIKNRGMHHFCSQSFLWSIFFMQNMCAHICLCWRVMRSFVLCYVGLYFIIWRTFFFFAVALAFFNGAPLHTEKEGVQTKCSESINVPTMVLYWSNTSFWLAYAVARKDPIILIPNVIGLLLGLMQGLLCLLYPSSCATRGQWRIITKLSDSVTIHLHIIIF
jgi:hypothetical protein